MDVHGNRGKCAQPCRLPYELTCENTSLSKGYLLSTKDLCGLEYLPALIKAGVACFKIEGRMKSPEYVATVTKIYRKYIDLAYSSSPYIIDENDKKLLLQVFNRGGFSTGHLSPKPNKELVFKDKQNHMGIYLGNVANVKPQKGHIFLNLNDCLSIGDTIQFENETSKYTVSELIIHEKNVKTATHGLVEIGRMKGNIKIGDKIFKVQSKELSTNTKLSYQKENIKVHLQAKFIAHLNNPIKLEVKTSKTNNPVFNNIIVSSISNITPIEATSKPITKERILNQLTKTGDTIFVFENIDFVIDNNIFIPSISSLNELRRNILEQILEIATNRITRKTQINTSKLLVYDDNENMSHNNKNISSNNSNFTKNTTANRKTLSLLLNILHTSFDYNKLQGIDNIYIPLKYFEDKKYSDIINILSNKFNMYIYLPNIVKANYRNILTNLVNKTIDSYNIKGFVISNISGGIFIDYMKKLYGDKFNYIANYTLNMYNPYTQYELKKLGLNNFTLSPELDKNSILNLCNSLNSRSNIELIVYGAIPLMTINYCLLGVTNKCYPTCGTKCLNTSKNINKDVNISKNIPTKYYLKDRLGLNFRILPDRIQTISTIYNSKILSLATNDFDNISNSYRIDILDENIEEINNIVSIVSSGKRMEGKQYTNGNMNREI